MNDVRFNKLLISVNALIPLSYLLYDWYGGNLGPNPVEYFLRATGVLTLVFLIVTLSITPLRKVFGWNGLIKYRRMLGMYAFVYALIHPLTYSVFDKSLVLTNIVSDVVQRPFIAIGMLAFSMLVPLAVTSTNGMIKRMGGKNWARLHKVAYPAAILGVVHFWMIVKSDIFYPAIFAVVLAVLLAYRLVPKAKPAAQVPNTAK